MTFRSRWLNALVVLTMMVATASVATTSQATTRSECGEPPGEAIVEAGLGRINVSGRLSRRDIQIVKKIRAARLVPKCTIRRQGGDTENLEEVLHAAESIAPYSYFIAMWGGGGLTVHGFVTESTASKLISLGGGPFPIDSRGLNVLKAE